MPRNLDRRVEALFPVEDVRLAARIRDESMGPLERDNSRVYEMGADGSYQRRTPELGARAIDGQQCAADRVHELDAIRSSPLAAPQSLSPGP